MCTQNLISLVCFSSVKQFPPTFPLLPGSSPCFPSLSQPLAARPCPCASWVMLFFPTAVLKDQFLCFPPLPTMDPGANLSLTENFHCKSAAGQGQEGVFRGVVPSYTPKKWLLDRNRASLCSPAHRADPWQGRAPWVYLFDICCSDYVTF